MSDEIVNRVAKSPIKEISLGAFYPEKEIVAFDIKKCLFQELIIKEKDFRAFVKEHDWSQYAGRHITFFCSTDAIVPVWAYMLMSASAAPYAESVHFGTATDCLSALMKSAIDAEDLSKYKDRPMVIKGCGDKEIPEAAFVYMTAKLTGVAKSIMYGEPCSTVPIWKKPKK